MSDCLPCPYDVTNFEPHLGLLERSTERSALFRIEYDYQINVTATPTSQPPDRATQNYTKISYLYILMTLPPLNK